MLPSRWIISVIFLRPVKKCLSAQFQFRLYKHKKQRFRSEYFCRICSFLLPHLARLECACGIIMRGMGQFASHFSFVVVPVPRYLFNLITRQIILDTYVNSFITFGNVLGKCASGYLLDVDCMATEYYYCFFWFSILSW